MTLDPAAYFQTPNLAKLAQQGMRFSKAYSPSPTCSPARHAIRFGRSPAGFVEKADFIISKPGDLPRLREYLGMPEVRAAP